MLALGFDAPKRRHGFGLLRHAIISAANGRQNRYSIYDPISLPPLPYRDGAPTFSFNWLLLYAMLLFYFKEPLPWNGKAPSTNRSISIAKSALTPTPRSSSKTLSLCGRSPSLV